MMTPSVFSVGPELPTPAEQVYITAHAAADPAELALRLTGQRSLRANLVLSQVQGYQVLSRKVPSWASCQGVCFPGKLPLEQCSSETTARYKATLLHQLPLKDRNQDGRLFRMADLTGGFGVDLAFMAAGVDEALYLERQADLVAIVRHNYAVLGLTNVTVQTGDAASLLDEGQSWDLLYLDPARRSAQGGRVVALSDCEPDVSHLRSRLLKQATFVLIKLSPMLDISQALKQLPETLAVHVVAVDGECKELLFLMGPESSPEAVNLICVNLKPGRQDELLTVNRQQALAVEPRLTALPGKYLYEPNASLLKAGLFAYLTHAFPVKKLHPNTHLYTSDEMVADFPGRCFQVFDCLPYQPKHIHRSWPNLVKANLTVRNFPDSVAEVRKRLKLAEGGETYLFATTLLDETKALIRCAAISRMEINL